MKSFYLIVIAAVISFTACRTKEGEPGPAGESSLNKQGSVSGTITYTNDNGNDATTSFSYQYYESLEDNKFSYEDFGQSISGYQLIFKRRDLKDANNYFNVNLNGQSSNGIEGDPSFSNIDFSFYTVINNELYHFYDDSETEITNVKIDPATGRVTFDYSGNVYFDSGSGTFTGKADIILNRFRNNLD